MAARPSCPHRSRRLDRPRRHRAAGPQRRHRRGGGRRRCRDQGRGSLYHSRGQSGAGNQTAVSRRGVQPAGGARVVGLGSRNAEAGATRLPKAFGRGFSQQIRGCDRLHPSTPRAAKCSIVTDISIEGGRALLGGEILETSLQTEGHQISAVGSDHGRGPLSLDARDLLVLPGIVDLHGDAFERQMMPRPGVDFPVDVALIDSDRQAIANGITTVFHATTWSWEPGLRSGDNARQLLEAIESLRPQLAADTRYHLRQETYNLDAEDEICQWLADGRIDLLAFNDHTENTVLLLNKPNKRKT